MVTKLGDGHLCLKEENRRFNNKLHYLGTVDYQNKYI